MVQEALADIMRGCSELIDEKKLTGCLENYYNNGETYHVKAGFDPTAPDLHLGHTVLLNKLATFQKYGARIQFIIGDFTAMIGDPTGKSETRKKLSRDDVLANSESYKEQVFKVLDKEKTTVFFNSDWLGGMSSYDIIELTSKRTVARMLERDDFENRFKNNIDISVYEFLYPMFQGYDSVHLKSDLELGGTDQKFNLHMGRHLQKSYGLKSQQAVMMMPILEGLDGVKKMSKSLDNYIGVAEDPVTMFSKMLSISDELMWRYYELLSSLSLQDIQQLRGDVKSGKLHPKNAKVNLAKEMVARFHSQEAADHAEAEFDRVHKQHELPEDMETFSFEGATWVGKIFQDAGLVASTSELRRKVTEGGAKIDGEKITDFKTELGPGEYVAQVGRKKFAKIKVN